MKTLSSHKIQVEIKDSKTIIYDGREIPVKKSKSQGKCKDMVVFDNSNCDTYSIYWSISIGIISEWAVKMYCD